MAFDILPHGVADGANLLAIAAGGDFFSNGVALDNPQYAALACLVEFSGVTTDVNINLIVQTAATGVGVAAQGWIDTNSRVQVLAVNGVAGLQVQIPVADPVIDQCRLKANFTGGSTATFLATRWLADRSLTAL